MFHQHLWTSKITQIIISLSQQQKLFFTKFKTTSGIRICAKKLLNIYNRQISAQLERLRQEQRRVAVPIPLEHYQILKNGHKEIAAVITYDEKRLSVSSNQIIWLIINQDLLDTFCEPAEMDYILQLIDQLSLQSKQVDIFNTELDGVQRNGTSPMYSSSQTISNS